MGGVLIIITIVVPTLLWADLRHLYVWIAMFALLAFGAIGFIDDYAKVMNKRNLGSDGEAEIRFADARGRGDSRACWRSCSITALTRRRSTCRSSSRFHPDLLIHSLMGNPLTYVFGFRAVLHFRRAGGGGFEQCGQHHGRPRWPGDRPDGDFGGRAHHPRVYQRQSRTGRIICSWRAIRARRN